MVSVILTPVCLSVKGCGAYNYLDIKISCIAVCKSACPINFCDTLHIDNYTRTAQIGTVRISASFCVEFFLFQMDNLPRAEIAARREAATQDILPIWNTTQGAKIYALQCPCKIDCGCMPEDQVPRIIMNNCMFVGELGYFYVTQPFLDTYGFRVTWHCDDCKEEMACGFRYFYYS